MAATTGDVTAREGSDKLGVVVMGVEPVSELETPMGRIAVDASGGTLEFTSSNSNFGGGLDE